MYTENDIRIIDNAFPETMLQGALSEINQKGFRFGWASNKEKEYHHWNTFFAGKDPKNRNDVTSFLTQDVAGIWSLIKYQYINDPDTYPVRAYANAYTFGTEGYIHTDSKILTDMTYLIYVNEQWDRDWAGETVFFDGHNILKAVLPKWNRLVIFPSAMDHCARSVSRICSKLRVILVYKSKVEKSESNNTN